MKIVRANCPIVAAVKALLPQAVVAPETGAQDRGNGAVTAHTCGAALDIFYGPKKLNGTAATTESKAYGRGLVSLFIRHRATLKWGSIEHDRMEFSPSGVKASTDATHDNHIHIDWIDYGSVGVFESLHIIPVYR